MRLGIMSDSHGNIEYVREAANYMVQEGVDWVIHLGDDLPDAFELDDLSIGVIKVPGVFEEIYKDPSIPNRLIVDLEELRFLVSHTRESHRNDLPQDLRPEELIKNKEVDIVLFGHSHLPEAQLDHGVLFINPGHLKKEDKKGEPSFAIVDIKGGQVKVKILGVDRKVRFEGTFNL